MFSSVLKKLASYFPEKWQVELKRIHYTRAIRRDRFSPDEPEDKILESLICEGDFVFDVGANIGHYTKRFSDLVGTTGRVIAIEPIPTTFSLLSANTSLFRFSNVTLLNVAASSATEVIGFTIPFLPQGLKNYYMANIDREHGELKVLCMPVDSLSLEQKVSLVKIDVEGHELEAIKGMQELIRRDKPTMIVETRSEEVVNYICDFGYTWKRLENSPNVLFTTS